MIRKSTKGADEPRRLAALLLATLMMVLVSGRGLAGGDSSPGPPPETACAGDCDGDGRVTIAELITGVNIALGLAGEGDCPSLDADGDGVVGVDELVGAVRNALDGCPLQGGAVFLIRACASPQDPDGQTFRTLIRDPAVVAVAESLIGAGQVRILNGALLPGDGGFNQPWGWHHDPSGVEFDEVAIELCDGCPQFVQDDLAYWLDVVGRYCPWSTEVVARER